MKIISFFIKEAIKFKIEISDGENNIINRNINYKENIIIKPKISKGNYTILIYPDEEIINSTMIVKITHSNSSPFYLKQNQLNLGFIPIEVDHYYYYMKVFKGEEGEIQLFNKRQNGILLSKIIKKNKGEIIPNINEFPKNNENYMFSNYYLKFNLYSQNLMFNSSHTEKCEEGCFLLITYYSNISKSLEIKGTEFSILSRIWDEEEFSSQIINIPLSEYIFGSIEEKTVNTHYYSVYIPYDTDDIFIEMHGKTIFGFAKEGISKIYTYKISSNTKQLFEDWEDKMIIALNKEDIKLDSFKGKYISFAFEEKTNDYSYYYFRILQQNPDIDYMIYPLDTNKENFCEKYDDTCYFLLKNEYNDLLNKIDIYVFGEDVSYTVLNMKETDYYSSKLDINNLSKTKEIETTNGHLSLNLKEKENYILLIINSIEDYNLIVIPSFYKHPDSSFMNMYSYQLNYLPKNELQQFHLYPNPFMEYRILINNVQGEGYICFAKTCNRDNYYIHLKEKKIYSFSIVNRTSFFIYAENNSASSIKIIHQILNKEIIELNEQYNFIQIKPNKEIFPLLFFVKDLKYSGININFFFKFNDSDSISNNLIIKGYTVNYNDMNAIIDKNDFKIEQIDSPYEINGKYDNITNSGTIELIDEFISTEYNDINRYTEDEYYIILLYLIQ